MSLEELEKQLQKLELSQPSDSYQSKGHQLLKAKNKHFRIKSWNRALASALVFSLVVNVYLYKEPQQISDVTKEHKPAVIAQKKANKYSIVQGATRPTTQKSNLTVIWESINE